jgi:hypothetical protein
MTRNLGNRLAQLEQKANHGFQDMIPVHTKEEAEVCRAWWRRQNPGLPDERLLIIITGVPRANVEPWDKRPLF